MTEKIARRGVRVPAEYEADFLDQVLVRDVIRNKLVTLHGTQTLQSVRDWIVSRVPGSTHQGYPVLNGDGHLLGVLTRRALLDPGNRAEQTLAELIARPPVIVYADNTLRDAADHMVNHDIGRLPVVDRETRQVIGIITRSDLLGAHRRRLSENLRPAA
jgi:CBS domain-containing protein